MMSSITNKWLSAIIFCFNPLYAAVPVTMCKVPTSPSDFRLGAHKQTFEIGVENEGSQRNFIDRSSSLCGALRASLNEFFDKNPKSLRENTVLYYQYLYPEGGGELIALVSEIAPKYSFLLLKIIYVGDDYCCRVSIQASAFLIDFCGFYHLTKFIDHSSENININDHYLRALVSLEVPNFFSYKQAIDVPANITLYLKSDGDKAPITSLIFKNDGYKAPITSLIFHHVDKNMMIGPAAPEIFIGDILSIPRSPVTKKVFLEIVIFNGVQKGPVCHTSQEEERFSVEVPIIEQEGRFYPIPIPECMSSLYGIPKGHSLYGDKAAFVECLDKLTVYLNNDPHNYNPAAIYRILCLPAFYFAPYVFVESMNLEKGLFLIQTKMSERCPLDKSLFLIFKETDLTSWAFRYPCVLCGSLYESPTCRIEFNGSVLGYAGGYQACIGSEMCFIDFDHELIYSFYWMVFIKLCQHGFNPTLKFDLYSNRLSFTDSKGKSMIFKFYKDAYGFELGHHGEFLKLLKAWPLPEEGRFALRGVPGNLGYCTKAGPNTRKDFTFHLPVEKR